MSTEVLVLTGPESCGKSTLASALAAEINAPCIPEIARTYLEGKASYQVEDLLAIAKQQQLAEEAALNANPPVLICDTDLLVIMIWSEVKYGACDPWIIEAFEANQQNPLSNRLYCLCDYDVPWQPDPLRENPDNRDELFDLYQQKLEDYKLRYCIAKGTLEERTQQVLNSLT